MRERLLYAGAEISGVLMLHGSHYRVGGLALSLVMGNRSSVGITYRTIILSFFHEDVQSLVEWMACGSGDLWHFPLLTVPQDTRTALRRWRSYITKS